MEIEFDILPDGSIRFGRRDPKTNDQIYKIVSQLAPSQKEAVREFLDCSRDIVLIFGNESFCG